MSTSVFAIYSNQDQVNNAVQNLNAAGFPPANISLLASDTTSRQDTRLEANSKAPEGATTGGLTGGALGAVAGWLAGIGSLAIPGAGPFIAAGPILAALSGAAVGASVGGIAGALIGMGMTEVEARQYEGKIREGKLLLSVHCDTSEQVEAAKRALQNTGAEQISSSAEASVSR